MVFFYIFSLFKDTVNTAFNWLYPESKIPLDLCVYVEYKFNTINHGRDFEDIDLDLLIYQVDSLDQFVDQVDKYYQVIFPDHSWTSFEKEYKEGLQVYKELQDDKEFGDQLQDEDEDDDKKEEEEALLALFNKTLNIMQKVRDKYDQTKLTNKK